MVYLALTYDHRLVDGADAARFLVTVKYAPRRGSLRGRARALRARRGHRLLRADRPPAGRGPARRRARGRDASSVGEPRGAGEIRWAPGTAARPRGAGRGGRRRQPRRRGRRRQAVDAGVQEDDSSTAGSRARPRSPRPWRSWTRSPGFWCPGPRSVTTATAGDRDARRDLARRATTSWPASAGQWEAATAAAEAVGHPRRARPHRPGRVAARAARGAGCSPSSSSASAASSGPASSTGAPSRCRTRSARWSFLLTADVSGPVNLTCPHPVTNAEATTATGSVLHRPTLLPVPGFGLRLVLGEFASEPLRSQRVLPKALLAAGFTFDHPTVKDAIRAAL